MEPNVSNLFIISSLIEIGIYINTYIFINSQKRTFRYSDHDGRFAAVAIKHV